MSILSARGEVTPQGVLKVQVPCKLPPGPVDVELNVRSSEDTRNPRDWDLLYGLGQEVWKDVDAQTYLEDLRQDRDCTP